MKWRFMNLPSGSPTGAAAEAYPWALIRAPYGGSVHFRLRSLATLNKCGRCLTRSASEINLVCVSHKTATRKVTSPGSLSLANCPWEQMNHNARSHWQYCGVEDINNISQAVLRYRITPVTEALRAYKSHIPRAEESGAVINTRSPERDSRCNSAQGFVTQAWRTCRSQLHATNESIEQFDSSHLASASDRKFKASIDRAVARLEIDRALWWDAGADAALAVATPPRTPTRHVPMHSAAHPWPVTSQRCTVRGQQRGHWP